MAALRLRQKIALLLIDDRMLEAHKATHRSVHCTAQEQLFTAFPRSDVLLIWLAMKGCTVQCMQEAAI
jgi:hypothetical protein